MNSTRGGPYRVVQFPGAGYARENPYRRLFYAALQPYGVQCVGVFSPTERWVESEGTATDAVHIHWPEDLWRAHDGDRLREIWHVIRLFRVLRILRHRRVKRIWTVHNLEHHEGGGWLDRCGYRILAREADLLICHSREAARTVAGLYRPRGAVVVMPHGNLAGVYPPPRQRTDVLRELGLRSDRPTIAIIGSLRRYKGIDIAVQGMARLAGTVQTIIAGKPYPPDYLPVLRRDIERLAAAAFVDRFVSDQELADVVGASDAVLLSYRHVTTSAALSSAWSMDRGVVASRLPYFEEMLEPEPDAGALFAPADPRDLAGAVERYLRIPVERRTSAVRRMVARYPWDRCIMPVATVIEQWLLERAERL